MIHTGKFINLTGQRFGRLTVISYAGHFDDGRIKWECRCDCGRIKHIRGKDLKNGKTKSCGCLSQETTAKRNTSHGMTHTRLYDVWSAMIKRCNNPNDKRWKDYGGRGITVCEEWKNDFVAFKDLAFANGYDENAEFFACTIERINVDGNYEPSNCCWKTMKQQANNTRKNRNITFQGETHTLSEWGEITGIPSSVIWKRLRRGRTEEAALTKPVRPQKKRKL